MIALGLATDRARRSIILVPPLSKMHPGLWLARNVGRLTGLLAIRIQTEECSF